MKKIFLLLLTLSVALFACKKETQLEEDLDDIKATVHTPVKRAPGQKKAERIAEILEKCKA